MNSDKKYQSISENSHPEQFGSKSESLTENEKAIIEVLRSGKATSLSISMDASLKPTLLSWTNGKFLEEDQINDAIAHLKLNGYKQVVIKTNGSKAVYLEQTIKQKLPISGNKL